MAGALHQALVMSLGLARKRFRKTVARAIDQCDSACTPECLASDSKDCICGHTCECGQCDSGLAEYVRTRFRVVPDSYSISRTPPPGAQWADNVGVVTCYEVDVTHPLDDRRLREYADAWEMFDASDTWVLELICIDRYGRRHPINLCAMSYALMVAEVENAQDPSPFVTHTRRA